MSQSLSQILVHLVFSTKNRHDLIGPGEISSLHAYIAASCRNLGCAAMRVGGTTNHVHIAYRLSRTVTISRFVEQIKKTSSAWMKQLHGGRREFSWQNGYGAFSVSTSRAGPLFRYIEAQAEHHRTRTFEEEFIDLLKRAGVEYDERYLWS